MKNNQFEEKFKNVLIYIKQQRKLKEINQITISNQLNLNRSTYNQIELGNTSMTAAQLLEILNYLQISAQEIESIYLKNKNSNNSNANNPSESSLLREYITRLEELIAQQRNLIQSQQELLARLGHHPQTD